MSEYSALFINNLLKVSSRNCPPSFQGSLPETEEPRAISYFATCLFLSIYHGALGFLEGHHSRLQSLRNVAWGNGRQSGLVLMQVRWRNIWGICGLGEKGKVKLEVIAGREMRKGSGSWRAEGQKESRRAWKGTSVTRWLRGKAWDVAGKGEGAEDNLPLAHNSSIDP